MTARLGHYELLTHLASGGMAEIYAARSVEHEADVVIVKQMLPQFAESREFVEMFLDEGRIVSLLTHPNIVRMHDFGFQGERPFLAMEYLHGVDLRTLMRASRTQRRAIPLTVALSIVSGMCAGLHHAHDATSLEGHPMDIVHRDVSPQNVVITFEGVAKLIDFGIAKSRDRMHETQAGALKGKIPYMSPEQVRGMPVDRRTDIYALGVILYELVTGRRPYVIDKTDEPKGEFSLMMAIVGGKIARPSAVRESLPRSLEAVILRALSGKVSTRYPTADAMRVDLTACAEELGISLQPTAVADFIRETFGVQHERWQQLSRRANEDLATEIESVAHMRDATTEGMDPTSIEVTEINDVDAVISITVDPAPAGVALVTIDARLDESFHGAARAATLTGPCVLDLRHVERISSFGVREWLELQRAVEARGDAVTLYLARCSEAVITQIGMVRAFVGRAQLVSFVAPYLCGGCGASFTHVFDCERDAKALDGGASPLVPCTACGAASTLDDDVSYFTPVRPYLGRACPPDVRDLLERLEADTGAANVVDKRVDGQLTCVRFLRAADRTFRWARLLDGVEGALELDLAAARLDSTSGDTLLAALRGLGSEVTTIRIDGAPPGLTSRLAEAPRCEVRTVAIEGRCPTCVAPRSALLSPAELAALRRGQTIAVPCRRCDTGLVGLELGSVIPPPSPMPAPPARRTRIGIIAVSCGLALALGAGGLALALTSSSDDHAAPSAPPAAVRMSGLADPTIAEAVGRGGTPEQALAAARLVASRELIDRVEMQLAPEQQTVRRPDAANAAVLAAFDAQLGTRVELARVSALRQPDGSLLARYRLAPEALATALAFYAAREPAWHATFAPAPPSRGPGLVVVATTSTRWRMSDYVIEIAGAPATLDRVRMLRDRAVASVVERDGGVVTLAAHEGK